MRTGSCSAPALSHAAQFDEVALTAFDALPERTCVLDRAGSIVLTNQTWNHAARDNGASLSRCGPGVNYLQVCRAATGLFSERASEAACGIEAVLRGASSSFSLDYPCPSASRKAWFRLIGRPLRGPQRGAVILHAEITSQVLLAERLRRAQADYGALRENLVDAATLLSADGIIRYQSPASEHLLGNLPEELVGHPIFEFVHPDDRDAVRKLLRGCQRYPRLKHRFEYRFRDRDGSWRMLEGIARKLRSDP